MNGSVLKYLLKEGYRNLWANKYMTLASIGVLSACLVLVGAAVMFAENVASLVGYVEDQNEIVVYINDDVDEAGISTIESQIQTVGGISELRFVSKEEALQSQREQLGDDAYLLDGFEEDNILPNSFVVRLQDVSQMAEVKAQLEAIEGVYQVDAPQKFADALVSVRNIVSSIGIILAVVLTVVAFVIIANTIRLTVFARRKEINIMKYVGATDSFIRIPFIVEGGLIGIMSSILSLAVCLGGYHFLLGWLEESDFAILGSGFSSFVSEWSMLPMLAVVFSVVGVLTGILSSYFSVRKHLKV